MILEDSYLISNFSSILWVFYPIGVLVLIELFLRSPNDDDDDDFGGGKSVLAYTRS